LEELPPAAQDSAVEVEEPVKAEVTAETHPQKEILPVGYVQVGRLVYELEGKWVAEETYRLARRPEGMEITSAGSFSVKVLFVPVRFSWIAMVGRGVISLRPAGRLGSETAGSPFP
jgi:hypothetical protein